MIRKSLLGLVFPLAVSGCLSSLENSLVYHPVPGSKTYDPPPAPIQDLELVMDDGTKIHARWAPHPRATGAVLYCHGNGGNIERWGRGVREVWENLGESVLIFDYPGYGYSKGKPSEPACDAAAETAYQWLTQTQKIPPGRILLMGESLGGGVAIDLASRYDHRALILVRTFTSIPDVADDQFPLLFSAPLVPDPYDNLKKIPACKQPTFIAQADKDRIIPMRHGQRLAQACATPAEFYVLRGLGHNDPLPAEFYVALRQFLAKVPPR
jgi:pimeloyl-ACP methyl ester carboxylesterase